MIGEMPSADEVIAIIKSLDRNETVISEFGFFSKPTHLEINGSDFVRKKYKAVSNKSFVDEIALNHELYIIQLRATGILVPETCLVITPVGRKFQINIVQRAFNHDELIRQIMQDCDVGQMNEICKLMIKDVLLFWQNKPETAIGFHPTLRNYAYKNGKLFYYDTFPPMLMEQKKLNMLIREMSPIKLPIQRIFPQRMFNRISDEYYHLDKMIVGIAGSACRLRPELSEEILETFRSEIEASSLNEEIKDKISVNLNQPPRLPGIWVSARKLLGKKGMPNIKRTGV